MTPREILLAVARRLRSSALYYRDDANAAEHKANGQERAALTFEEYARLSSDAEVEARVEECRKELPWFASFEEVVRPPPQGDLS